MALITAFYTPSGRRYGVVVDRTIYDCGSDLFAVNLNAPGQAAGTLDNMQLAPPVQPSKIVCVGRNYAAHAAEREASVPDEPMLFLKPPSALIGAGAPIEIPPGTGRVDHEAELAVIIGKTAHRVTRENALSHILGYTCANDVSARDFQKKDGQWGRAKGFDTFCPLGPWINTDFDPSDVGIRCTVNGELRQDARTADLVFNVQALVTFISSIMTLLPGDVILTGTPAGVSPLHDGDSVCVEIDGLGLLVNSVHGLPG